MFSVEQDSGDYHSGHWASLGNDETSYYDDGFATVNTLRGSGFYGL